MSNGTDVTPPTGGASPFMAAIGSAAPWVMGGLALVNYFSARSAQRKMKRRLTPIAEAQMTQIQEERGDIQQEYSTKAKDARGMGDLAMSQLYSSREAKLRTASQNVGATNLKFGSGNLAQESLLGIYNQQAGQQNLKTTSLVSGIQNQLAGELRGLDSAQLELKAMYAKQGIKLNESLTDVGSLKYV